MLMLAAILRDIATTPRREWIGRFKRRRRQQSSQTLTGCDKGHSKTIIEYEYLSKPSSVAVKDQRTKEERMSLIHTGLFSTTISSMLKSVNRVTQWRFTLPQGYLGNVVQTRQSQRQTSWFAWPLRNALAKFGRLFLFIHWLSGLLVSDIRDHLPVFTVCNDNNTIHEDMRP